MFVGETSNATSSDSNRDESMNQAFHMKLVPCIAAKLSTYVESFLNIHLLSMQKDTSFYFMIFNEGTSSQ